MLFEKSAGLPIQAVLQDHTAGAFEKISPGGNTERAYHVFAGIRYHPSKKGVLEEQQKLAESLAGKRSGK